MGLDECNECTSLNPILAKPNVTLNIPYLTTCTKRPFKTVNFIFLCRPRRLVESEQPIILMCETICFSKVFVFYDHVN